MKHSFVAIALFLTPCLAPLAGCGHEHGHEHAAEPEELEPRTVTVFGERGLVFIEYPPLVRGVGAGFLAHLSVLADGEPVRSGRVVLQVGATELAAEAPKRDGLFVPEGSFPVAGRFAAKLVVQGVQLEETFDLGEFVVHASEAEARGAAATEATPAPSQAAPFLLEQQWKVKLLLAEVEQRTLVDRLEVPARIVTPQGFEAVVGPPAAGRLLAPESGGLPRTGERVEAGQVLGLVEPPLAASDLAQLRALDLQAQSLDLEIELQALEVSRVLQAAQARLAFAEKEATRIASLREEGLSTVQQLDQAQQDLAVAKSDQAAAHSARQSLDRLLAGRATQPIDREAKPIRLPLVAPIAGVVLSVRGVVGESVHSEDEVFRLIDTGAVWIEGRISEFDLARVPREPGATLDVPALEPRRVDIFAAGGRMLHVEPIVEPSTRTLTIRYHLPNPEGRLKAGMLATLLLETRRASEVVAIPESAVVLEQGLPTAYVMLEGELFQKRELELGIRDGGYVEVRAGLQRGERVATRGAYAVKLAALTPAAFGAGHAH